MKEALELDLKEVFRIIIKRIWLILLCAAIVGIATYIYQNSSVPDRYQAKATLYINNKNTEDGDGNNLTSANLTTAQKLVKTYGTFIQSDLVLDQVAAIDGINKTASQIRSMVSTKSVNDTEMFAVYVVSTDPYEAANIANAIAKVAPSTIANIIEGSYAKEVDLAKVPSVPVDAGRETKAVIAAVIAAVAFVLRGMLDTHVRTEEELERICDIPVLGSIPDFEQSVKEAKKKARG